MWLSRIPGFVMQPPRLFGWIGSPTGAAYLTLCQQSAVTSEDCCRETVGRSCLRWIPVPTAGRHQSPGRCCSRDTSLGSLIRLFCLSLPSLQPMHPGMLVCCHHVVWLHRDADKVAGRVAKVLRKVSDLELIQAPNLPYTLPKEYRSLPHLTGMHHLESW